MRRLSSTWLAGILAAAAACGFSGCGRGTPEAPPPEPPRLAATAPETVIAVVDGRPVNFGAISGEVAAVLAAMRPRVPSNEWPQAEDRAVVQVLEGRIIRQVLTAEADRLGIAVTGPEISNALAGFTASLPPDMPLEQMLKEHQLTPEQFRQDLEYDLRVDKLIASQVTNAAARPGAIAARDYVAALRRKARLEFPDPRLVPPSFSDAQPATAPTGGPAQP